MAACCACRAVLPATVPACQLHLATTMDTLSWSLTGLVGAALSGYVAALFGSATCFLLVSVGRGLAVHINGMCLVV